MNLVDLAPQTHQESPQDLARIILWFLEKEKEILQTANLDEQVRLFDETPWYCMLYRLYQHNKDQLGNPCYRDMNIKSKANNELKY